MFIQENLKALCVNDFIVASSPSPRTLLREFTPLNGLGEMARVVAWLPVGRY